MRRPDVEKYEAMAEEATVGPWVAYTFDELDECDRRVIAVQTHRDLGLTHRTIDAALKEGNADG